MNTTNATANGTFGVTGDSRAANNAAGARPENISPTKPGDKAGPSPVAERETVAEKKFISQYSELTGASEAQARSVFMYSEIIQHGDPYRYRYE